ncbi:MAG: hypothetical protein KatS3mg117_0653 [Geminicoccaceae bacterium]|jgi:hypothetical protein|nr:MAG: hypothetical protein KatS3mg117_0653 [Geminicoccaceae bacterium]
MPMQEHVESLRSKHARLEQLIEEELHRPLPDQGVISRLKKEKLRIKEQIERIRGASDRSDPVPTH